MFALTRSSLGGDPFVLYVTVHSVIETGQDWTTNTITTRHVKTKWWLTRSTSHYRIAPCCLTVPRLCGGQPVAHLQVVPWIYNQWVWSASISYCIQIHYKMELLKNWLQCVLCLWMYKRLSWCIRVNFTQNVHTSVYDHISMNAKIRAANLQSPVPYTHTGTFLRRVQPLYYQIYVSLTRYMVSLYP